MAATPARPAGARPPMVLLHGIGDSARTWDLVRPALERWHEVLAPTLPGHLGGPALPGAADADAMAGWAEAAMDDAGVATAHMIRATAGAAGFEALTASARRDGWPLDAAAIRCPVRILWGTADRLLPWPAAAAALRHALPQAEWVELDGVGHHPQLEVPLETAELVLGISAPGRGRRTPTAAPG